MLMLLVDYLKLCAGKKSSRVNRPNPDDRINRKLDGQKIFKHKTEK